MDSWTGLGCTLLTDPLFRICFLIPQVWQPKSSQVLLWGAPQTTIAWPSLCFSSIRLSYNERRNGIGKLQSLHAGPLDLHSKVAGLSRRLVTAFSRFWGCSFLHLDLRHFEHLANSSERGTYTGTIVSRCFCHCLFLLETLYRRFSACLEVGACTLNPSEVPCRPAWSWSEIPFLEHCGMCNQTKQTHSNGNATWYSAVGWYSTKRSRFWWS